MALAISPVGKVTAPEPEAPKIYEDTYKHSIIDSTYQSHTSLLTQVVGTPRLVEYYRFFGESSEEPTPFNPRNAPTYQSYTRIKNVIIKQEGDGSHDFDSETGESNKTFTAYVIFDLTPVRYDVMIMDIGSGRAGLFNIIEQPEILNFTEDKVYRITYQLVSVLTNDLFNALNSRVVNELVYSRDSALKGGSAVITTTDFELANKLYSFRTTIAENILRKFYWNAERTIAFDSSLITKTNTNSLKIGMCYDQYLVSFIKTIINGDLLLGYPHINTLNTQYGGREFGNHSSLNIFDVLLRLDFNLLSQCSSDVHLLNVQDLANTRLYGSVASSKFVHALVTDKDNYGQAEKFYGFDGFPSIKLIQGQEATYLFSSDFYEGVPNNDFEKLILDIAKDRVMDRKALLEYCENYFNLTEIEQLYYGAILIYLIELTRRFDRGF